MRATKLLLIASIILLLSGCKLAVIVIEGGEVQSTGSGTCIASSICVVDVTDPSFSETFTAIPNEGWYFEQWQMGDRFLCGGATDPECTLSSGGYEEEQIVQTMVASSQTFYLMPVFTLSRAISDTVIVDGREWAQPDLFLALSWNDVNAVCPEGVCFGTLNGYDMTGWTWASVDDLNALFNYYIGRDELGPGPDWYMSNYYNTPWATAFFEDGWRPTSPVTEVRLVWGFTRDRPGLKKAYMGHLMDFISEDSEVEVSGIDWASTNATRKIELQYGSYGSWFYRNL